MTLWLNGALTEHETVLSASDRGLTLGDGLFETMLVRQAEAPYLARHLARMAEAARLLELPLPFDKDSIADAIAQLCAAQDQSEGAARLTVTRGPGARGLLPPANVRPTAILTLSPRPALPAAVRMITATVTRRNEHSPLSRLKSTNSLDNILARREAERQGADEALLLNTAGRVAETTTANLVASFRGRLLTPPAADGALPGIRLSVLRETIAIEDHPLDPPALTRADEIILLNSLGLRAVCWLDGRNLAPGPAFEMLSRCLY